jgi:superfamily II RNA helicase
MFLTHDKELTPFMSGKKLFPSVVPYANVRKKVKRSFGARMLKLDEVVDCMRAFNLLPAIIFLKSRADCDKALDSLPSSDKTPSEDGFGEIVKKVAGPELDLADQKQTEKLLFSRAGSHHAGQLPAWRLLIEKLMSMGYLDVIFSTSTVAAGVNFPARTVALVQSDRFNGREFVDMSATDIHQMTGRAGRRGMDNVGFALILPERHMKVNLVKELLMSQPEPLQSRIHINFSMTLNLLLSHDPGGVRKLLGMSLAAFHEDKKKAQKAYSKLVKDFQRHMSLLIDLEYVTPEGVPTQDGRWAAKLRLDHPLLIAELIREGEFNNLDPQELASLIAPFVVDKDRDVAFSRQLWIDTRWVWKRFRSMLKKLKPLMGFMGARGFEIPMIIFWPAAAAYMWASEVEWSELKDHVDADEGDMAMMLLRTADHLRQLAALEEEQPELARNARRAVSLIMRPPLI